MKKIAPILVALAIMFNLYMVVQAATEPKLSEISELRILNSYKDAVIANQSLAAAKAAVEVAQSQLNQKIADYNAVSSQEAKASRFPEGTKFNPDISNGKVAVVLPPKVEEKKPEVKK